MALGEEITSALIPALSPWRRRIVRWWLAKWMRQIAERRTALPSGQRLEICQQH